MSNVRRSAQVDGAFQPRSTRSDGANCVQDTFRTRSQRAWQYLKYLANSMRWACMSIVFGDAKTREPRTYPTLPPWFWRHSKKVRAQPHSLRLCPVGVAVVLASHLLIAGCYTFETTRHWDWPHLLLALAYFAITSVLFVKLIKRNRTRKRITPIARKQHRAKRSH
jgi:hypothetical protein